MNVRSVSKLSVSIISLVALIALSHCAKASHSAPAPAPTPKTAAPTDSLPKPGSEPAVERSVLIDKYSKSCLSWIDTTVVSAETAKTYCDCYAPKFVDAQSKKCGVVGTKVNQPCHVTEDENTAETGICDSIVQ
jgi:hypothetical protein